MITSLKRLALAGLTNPLVYGALRRRALRADPVTILCYHTLRPDHEALDAWTALRLSDFRSQINWLRQSYDIVSLETACGPGTTHGRPQVVLTFDDGEIGMIAHLLPIIQEEDLPVTIYIATEQIQTGKAYWFDRVMNALQGSGLTEIDLCEDGLEHWVVGPEQGKSRWAQIGTILEALKNTPTEQRDRLADRIVAQTQANEETFTPLAPMTISEVRMLSTDPRVTIGAHSHGHELLDQLALDDARDSIATSRDHLQEWTGQSIRHFAYPNGNHTPDLCKLLDELGFVSATILEDRLVHDDTPRQALPRVSIGRYDTLARLKLRMVGI